MQTQDLSTLAQLYGDYIGRSLFTVAAHVGVHNKTFTNLRDRLGCHIDTYTAAFNWFAAHWPADPEWPRQIPRPAKSKKEAAGWSASHFGNTPASASPASSSVRQSQQCNILWSWQVQRRRNGLGSVSNRFAVPLAFHVGNDGRLAQCSGCAKRQKPSLKPQKLLIGSSKLGYL